MSASRAATWRAGWSIARYVPRRYVFGGMLWALNHTVPIASGAVLKMIFDAVTDDAPVGVSAYPMALVAAFVGVEVGRVSIWWLAMYIWPGWWQAVCALMRLNVLRSLLCDPEPPAERMTGSSGEVVNRFRDDVEETMWFVDIWVDVAGGVFFTVLAVWIMVRIDPVITIAVIFPMIAVVIGTRAFSNMIRSTYTISRQSGSSVSSLVGELMSGVLALKVAGAEAGAMERLRAANETRGEAAVKASLFASLIEVCSVGAVELSIGLVLLLSAPAMQRGDFTVGDLALFAAYMAPLTALPRWSGRLLARQRQASVALDRMARLLPDKQVGSVVAYRPVYIRGEMPPSVPLPVGDARDDRLVRLEVEDLAVRHHSSGRGVARASLGVDGGSFTVITGAVGSGKSTLLRGLLGLLPVDSGSVRWNGVAIVQAVEFLVPPRVAYVAQVPRLFSAELRENLLLGWPADENDLTDALRLAALDDDVARMPEGLATVVGARGVRLSGGQLQRATAARALVRRPDLLVLDDLSSALDIETEQRLWERLAARPDAACLAVSHRRAALERADQVVVLEEGQVVGAGPLHEVLRTTPEMRRLWREELVVEAEELA